MALFYLVGSNHVDLKGPERLRKFLNFVRPTMIGLEASQELIQQKLNERLIVKEELKKQKEFEKIRLKLNLSKKTEDKKILEFLATLAYEIWVPYEHKKEENPNVDIYPIHDHNVLLKANAETWDKVLEKRDEIYPSNLEEFQKEIDNWYFDLETTQFYQENPDHLAFVKELDDTMESRIRSIITKNNETGTTIIIAGNAHIFGNYDKNLFERLQDFSPIRIRLPEIDKF